MSRADVTVQINVNVERFGPALLRAWNALDRLIWAEFWAQWGTDGRKRRTALVLYESRREAGKPAADAGA